MLAHNLIRWAVTMGDDVRADELVVARSVRTGLIAAPARLVNRSDTPTLRAPLGWPWASWFTTRLAALRALRDTG